jgi:hypothetical protein
MSAANGDGVECASQRLTQPTYRVVYMIECPLGRVDPRPFLKLSGRSGKRETSELFPFRTRRVRSNVSIPFELFLFASARLGWNDVRLLWPARSKASDFDEGQAAIQL